MFCSLPTGTFRSTMHFLPNLARCPGLWQGFDVLRTWSHCGAASKKEQGKRKEWLSKSGCLDSLAVMVQLLQPLWEQCKLWKLLEANTDLVVTVPGPVLWWVEVTSLGMWHEQKIKYLGFTCIAYWWGGSDISITCMGSACRLWVRLCFDFHL